MIDGRVIYSRQLALKTPKYSKCHSGLGWLDSRMQREGRDTIEYNLRTKVAALDRPGLFDIQCPGCMATSLSGFVECWVLRLRDDLR